MALPPNLMPLAGSALATPSALCLGPLPPLEQLDVVISLRRPVRSADVTAVVRFAHDRGLRILDVDHRQATVDARGSVLALSSAFGVRLLAYAGPDGTFRARRGTLHIPVSLAGAVVAVDGLDRRPGPSRRRTGGPAHHPSTFALPMSAAPRVRAERACVEPAGRADPPVLPPVAGEDHARVVPGGCDAGAAPAGLATVLHLPVRPAPAPPDHLTDLAGSPPVPLAPARARRRGPLAVAALEQREQRFARRLHPAGVDRS